MSWARITSLLVAAACAMPICLAHAARGQSSSDTSQTSFGGQAATRTTSAPARSYVPRRLVRFFDFDERDEDNFEDLPRSWYIIGRPAETSDPNFKLIEHHQQMTAKRGYPAFNEVRFDDRQHVSGKESLYLQLRGGDVGAFLEVGSQAAVPDSDYLISAKVRTQNLEHAHASLVAYFVDEAGRRIEASATTSEPVRTSGRWDDISVRLKGNFAHAAWIGCHVQVLQSRPDPDHLLGDQQIVLTDINGAAWFDDVAVWQLPHVQVSTNSQVNLMRAPKRAVLDLSVRDLTGQQIQADTRIYDLNMQMVARQQRPVGAGEPTRWRWTPDLPGYGWYLVDMLVTEPGPDGSQSPIARTLGAFVWLAPALPSAMHDKPRFMLIADDLPDEQLQLVPAMLAATGMQSVMIDGWDRSMSMTLGMGQTADLRRQMIEDILVASPHTMMAFAPLPVELAQQPSVDLRSTFGAMQAPADVWMPYVRPILRSYGQRVERWPIGRINEQQAAFAPDLPRLLSQWSRHLRSVAPKPRIVLPWSAYQPARSDLPENTDFLIAVPGSIAPGQITEQFADWPARTGLRGGDYWLVFDVPPATLVNHHRRATDLALRMIHAWQLDGARLALPKSWTRSLENRSATLPDPMLGVFVSVAQHLSGRKIVGELRPHPGVRCLILDGPAGGMLVAWNRNADPQQAVLDMHLGSDPVVTDMWGNAESMPTRNGRHYLQLSKTPVFISKIDTKLALFRAGFAISPSFIRSTQEPHQRTMTLTNPWSRTLNGKLRLVGPKGWRFHPSSHVFSIASGRTIELPVQVSFPVFTTAGVKKLQARVDMVGEKHHNVLLTAPLEVGLKDVRFDASMTLEHQPDDTTNAVVTCIVTNTGLQDRALYVFANLTGHRRQERIVPRLEPGQSVVRRFHFKDAGEQLLEHPIRAGIRETNGPAVINHLLSLDDASR